VGVWVPGTDATDPNDLCEAVQQALGLAMAIDVLYIDPDFVANGPCHVLELGDLDDINAIIVMPASGVRTPSASSRSPFDADSEPAPAPAAPGAPSLSFATWDALDLQVGT
jgi:hypothetical protein